MFIGKSAIRVSHLCRWDLISIFSHSLHSLHTNTMLQSAIFGLIGGWHLLDISLNQPIRWFGYVEVYTPFRTNKWHVQCRCVLRLKKMFVSVFLNVKLIFSNHFKSITHCHCHTVFKSGDWEGCSDI